MMDGFRNAIRAAGMTPPDVIEPAKFYKFPGADKGRGNKAGWCKLFPDGMGGVFGDYSRDYSDSWQEKLDRPRSFAEQEAFSRHVAEAKRQAETERQAQQEATAERARQMWGEAKPASNDHPYLARKKICAYDIRELDGKLLVPLRFNKQLHNLQLIDADGGKRYLKGGRTGECYYPLAGDSTETIIVCEGYATGASIREAGYSVAVAFSAGNLLPVALKLHELRPDSQIIVAADNDVHADGKPNVGVEKAREAAQAVNGLLAVPELDGKKCDFNDVHQARGLDAVRSAIEAVALPPTRNRGGEFVAYRCVDTVESKPIHWLWPGRVARGKVSIIAGNPGLGKSQATLSMAAIVTTGGHWPADHLRAEQGSVVLLSAEDDAADTIRPRLEAAGADISRVFVLDAVREVNADGEAFQRGFNLKTDLTRLEAMLSEVGNVTLIVIDPITANLGSADSHKNADIRALLAPLSDMAARYDVAVVGVSHLNKSGGNDALTRVMGSLAFVAAARAAWIVAKDPENERRRLFLPAKNNIAEDQSGLAFAIQSAQVDSPAGPIDTSVVEWETEPVTVAINDVIGPQADSEDRDALSDAKEFLRGLLADEPLPVKQVRADADGAGHAWATIRRAQKALGVEINKEGGRFGNGKQQWVWHLPEQKVLTEDARQNNLSTFCESRASKGFNHAGFTEGAQVPMTGHLQGNDEHLQQGPSSKWGESV